MSSSSRRGAAPRWLSADQEAAWRAYRRMRALLDLQITRDLAADSGLSDADYDVLSNLSEAADRRQRLKELAATMLWSESRLSHHISRMQERGLVTRERAPDDGRGTVVELTQHGWEVLTDAAPRHVESVRRNLIDLLSRDEIRTLHAIAGTVVAALTRDGSQSPANGP